MPKTQVSYPHRHSRWFLVPTTFVVGTSAKAYKENAAPALKHRLRIFSLKYYVFSKTTEVRYYKYTLIFLHKQYAVGLFCKKTDPRMSVTDP